MKKEIKKMTKQEKEKIENKLLTVFAVALGSIMILLYLINWFQGSIGFQRAAEVIVYVLLAGFIGLSVLFKLKSNKAKKENLSDKAKKFNNWFIFSVVAAVISFIVYPSRIMKLIKLDVVDSVIFNKLTLFGMGTLATRLVILIALIAIYTIVVFIYYGVKTHKAHKASLNKGNNKKK